MIQDNEQGEGVRAGSREQSRFAVSAVPASIPDAPRYWTDWHEDIGDVLWWKWPIEEAPYVGTPLDLGHVVTIDLEANSSCGRFAGGKHNMRVGGWPFGDEDSEDRECLWWTPLPDHNDLDRAIRDEIRGGPDPFAKGMEARRAVPNGAVHDSPVPERHAPDPSTMNQGGE